MIIIRIEKVDVTNRIPSTTKLVSRTHVIKIFLEIPKNLLRNYRLFFEYMMPRSKQRSCYSLLLYITVI